MLKNNTRLLLLFLAHIISGISSGVSMIAIPWYFTNNLNLNSTFSVIFGSVTLIGLFWGLYSGTIIDKYNRKTILEKLNFYVGLKIENNLFKGEISLVGGYISNLELKNFYVKPSSNIKSNVFSDREYLSKIILQAFLPSLLITS